MIFSITRFFLFILVSSFLLTPNVYSQQSGPYCLEASQCGNTQCASGYELVTFLGGVCDGIDYCCYPEGEPIDPPYCSRGFYPKVKLLDSNPDVDVANINDSTYSFEQQPYGNENLLDFEIEARVPLGRRFTIEYKADPKNLRYPQDCHPEESVKIAGTFVLDNQVIDPTIAEPDYVFFPNNSVIQFGTGNNIIEKEFFAIHLGTASLVITPTDPTIPKIKINVTIEKPSFLGAASSHERDTSELQDYIFDIAHHRGIPPQMIKAWIQKETFAVGDNFNPRTYRYEPNFDRINFRNPNSYLLNLYSNFVIQDIANGWAETGQYVLQPFNDPILNARNRFNICINNCTNPNDTTCVNQCNEPNATNRITRKIEQADLETQAITAFDIADNNRQYNLIPGASYLDPVWRTEAIIRYGFTAQTIISSSYGLVNMMHPTFVALLRSFDVVSNSRTAPSPQLLYDIPAYTGVNVPTESDDGFSNGTSSLNLSSLSLFRRSPNIVITTNSNYKAFTDSYKRFFDAHNPNEIVYGRNVINIAPTYLPKPIRCVLSNGETC